METEQVQEKAQEAADQARGRVREQVDQRSTEIGDKVLTQVQDAKTVAEELRKQGKDQPAKLAEQVAEKAEQVGSYLKSTDADRLLHDVEDFGRQKPWAMVAGGLALGLAASRFLKASSTERSRSVGTHGTNGRYSGQQLPEQSSAPNGLGQTPTTTPGF
jgi:ElaB/YqjD/DUF883 family membrane-anchored ribosome-binding protein